LAENHREPRLNYDGLQDWIEGGSEAPNSATVGSTVELSCERCRTRWTSPSLDADGRHRLAGYVRKNRPLEGYALCRQFGFQPWAAKQTMLHIASVPGKCNRYERPLGADGEMACSCRALNLDW
jgi:hypothetical protein